MAGAEYDIAVGCPALLPASEEVVDDAVTSARRELKFTFPHADVAELGVLLEVNARRVVFGAGPVSRVNSIYFDDERVTSAQESLAGAARRTKLRLRWYDRPLADGAAFFEDKDRRGLNISKQRVGLRTATPLADCTYRQLIDDLDRLLDDEQGALLRLRCEPVVLVSYKRQHFRDPASGIRLTLDYDIVGYDQLGLPRPARRFGVALADAVVVEVKAPPALIGAVPALLHPLRPRVTRFSKYVECCQRTAWWTVHD